MEGERMSKPQYAYIGRCTKCGKVHAAIVIDPRYKKDTRQAVDDMLKNDLIIEHVLSVDAMQDFDHCTDVSRQLNLLGDTNG
jgi:hypothetical protein